MGSTIVGGALTSSFAAIFLIICQADSLNKFGIMLLTTIMASMLTALFFMPAMLYILGPDND